MISLKSMTLSLKNVISSLRKIIIVINKNMRGPREGFDKVPSNLNDFRHKKSPYEMSSLWTIHLLDLIKIHLFFGKL